MNIRAFFLFSTASLIYLLLLGLYQDHRCALRASWEAAETASVSGPLDAEALDLFGGLQARSSRTLTATRQRLQGEPEPVGPPEVECDPTILRVILSYNSRLALTEARSLARDIELSARRNGIDPFLLTALISQESAFQKDALSPVGAIGYGQLMPGTARELGVNPHHPEDNLEGAARYLSWQIRRWADHENGLERALASYNAGPGAVAKFDGIPPYLETRNYVRRIRARYRGMRAG